MYTLSSKNVVFRKEIYHIVFEFINIVLLNIFREEWPKLSEVPFNSTTKYQSSVHGLAAASAADDNEINSFSNILVMKGAPERVVERFGLIVNFPQF